MRGFAVVGLISTLAACSSDSGLKKYNSDPEVSISSHSSGDTVVEGVAEIIRGQVGDPNHAIADLSVTWLMNGTETCEESAPDEEGVVSCEMTFGTDGAEISLEVRDPEGAGASAAVTLEVQPTDAPVAAITAPAADGVYYSDQLITFQGTVSDTEDDIDALTVAFETADLGDLELDLDITSEGAVEAFGSLDEGEHAVKLRVTDTTGKEGVDSVVIRVGPPNSAPTCAITAPETGSAGPEGELITFTGTAGDVDVAADWLTVEWSSDKDGSLGSSTPTTGGDVVFNYGDLSVDTHTITMTVTDEIGATCTDLTVFTVGTPPVLTVTAPTDGATLNHNDAVVFEATVEDNEDLPNEVSLSWESDLDGVFSTDGADSSGAATVSIDSLSPGDHVVTVTATDTDGLFVTDTVSFNLNQPPTTPTVTLEPDPAATNQMLVATATGSVDPEGTGTVTYAYAWFEDGVATAESASATFPASATGKNHTYRVQVTASDGLVESAFGFAEVNVINSAPALAGPSLSAATAIVGDVLTCSATATDLDPEDSPIVSYVWSDGSTGPSYTVTMADAVDSTITCTATADDADGGIATGTASATVTNTAPVMGTVSITPDPAYNDDTLVCTATATDADGTAPDITYAWTGGATTRELPLTSIIAASGDTLTCTATATDAYGETDVGTASITLGNRSPSVTVAITPETPNKSDTLTCTASGVSDPDDDATTLAFTWTVGGSPVAASSTSGTITTLAAAFLAGQTVACRADVDDGKTGTGTDTASVVIGNTAPAVSSVTLTPSSLYTNDTVTAMATTTDADGDDLTLTYAFSVDGTVVQDGASNTLDGAVHFDKGQVVTVTVTADDGTDTGSDTSSGVTVLNTAPTAPAVSIQASSGTTWTVETGGNGHAYAVRSPAEPLTWLEAQSEAEAEGGYLATLTSEAENNWVYDTLLRDSDVWSPYGNGPFIGLRETASGFQWVSGETLDWANWIPGDPNGGAGNDVVIFYSGIAGTPRSTWADVDFDQLISHYVVEWEDSSIACMIDEASEDADGDPITYTFAWDVDGTPFTDTETTIYTGDTIDNDDLGYDETWTCEVNPDDGSDVGPSGIATLTMEGDPCDSDADGYESEACGGSDCNDDDASIHPFADDTYGDGVDTNCDDMDCEGRSVGDVYFVGCDEFITYDEANTACMNAGYDSLAAILDFAENEVVESILRTVGYIGKDFWIGMNDRASEGTYRLEDGTLATYFYWGPGEPHGRSYEDCVAMDIPSYSGRWIDAPCGDDREGFVCEARP